MLFPTTHFFFFLTLYSNILIILCFHCRLHQSLPSTKSLVIPTHITLFFNISVFISFTVNRTASLIISGTYSPSKHKCCHSLGFISNFFLMASPISSSFLISFHPHRAIHLIL